MFGQLGERWTSSSDTNTTYWKWCRHIYRQTTLRSWSIFYTSILKHLLHLDLVASSTPRSCRWNPPIRALSCSSGSGSCSRCGCSHGSPLHPSSSLQASRTDRTGINRSIDGSMMIIHLYIFARQITVSIAATPTCVQPGVVAVILHDVVLHACSVKVRRHR